MFVTWDFRSSARLFYFIVVAVRYLLSGMLSFVGRSGEGRILWPS